MKAHPLNKSFRAILISALMAFAASLPLAAQTYDTLKGPGGRLPGYYYPWWYDECRVYTDTTSVFLEQSRGAIRISWYGTGNNPDYLHSTSNFVDHPAAIVGIGVFTIDQNLHGGVTIGAPLIEGPRRPEYIYIFSYDSIKNATNVLGKFRWDTCQTKLIRLPRHADTARFGYCLSYFNEIRLDTAIIVDSMFFVAGTWENNRGYPFLLTSPPTFYSYIQPNPIVHADPTIHNEWCIPPQRVGHFHITDSQFWMEPFRETFPEFGPYLVMIDFANLDVRSSDSVRGTAGPSGRLSMHVGQQIYATPHPGYRFSHWNDGDTANPRYVLLESDTSFVAYFAALDQFYVETRTENPYGLVSGSGYYYEGDTVQVHATSRSSRYHFARWNDGDTANPRNIVVTQDTTLIAIFASAQGIDNPDAGTPLFTIMPNPARSTATLTLSDAIPAPVECHLTFRDAAGRELFTIHALIRTTTLTLADLPAGVYFVTLTAPQASATQRLIVE